MKDLKNDLFKNYNEQVKLLDKQLELLNLIDKELNKQLTLTDVVKSLKDTEEDCPCEIPFDVRYCDKHKKWN